MLREVQRGGPSHVIKSVRTFRVTLRTLPIVSCSQLGRSSVETTGFFFTKPAASRGGSTGGLTAGEGRGIGLGLGGCCLGSGGGGGGGVGLDVPDVEGVDEDEAAFWSFASLLRRI